MQCDINNFGTGTLVRAMCSMLQRSILYEQQPRKMWQWTLMIFCSSSMVSIGLDIGPMIWQYSIKIYHLQITPDNACKYHRYNSIINIYEVQITIISSIFFYYYFFLLFFFKLLLYIFCIHVILFLGVCFSSHICRRTWICMQCRKCREKPCKYTWDV